jgi:predicted RNA-binding protein with EMAP domain
MNKVLSLVRAARTSSEPVPILNSDHMLAELLALHEDMIEQLRLERVQVVDSADFLTGMIEQHEAMSAMLRTKLNNSEVGADHDGVIVITGEASSAAAKSLVTKFAEGARGVTPVRNDMTVRP